MICHVSSLARPAVSRALELPRSATSPLVASCPRARAPRRGPGGPGDAVCLFESDWDRVDAARMQADSAGIADRVSVHHALVLDLLRPACGPVDC